MEGGFEEGGGVDGDDHSDEVGGVGGAHFGGEVGAVVGGGFGGDAEVGGDHFVGESLDDELEDGLFAGGEGAEAVLDVASDLELFSAGEFVLEESLDAGDDVVEVDGFFEEVDGAEFEAVDGGADIGVAGDHDDGEGGVVSAELFDDGEAAHVGEAEVEEEATGGEGAEVVEEGGAIVVALDAEVSILEGGAEAFEGGEIVIDNINDRGLEHNCRTYQKQRQIDIGTRVYQTHSAGRVRKSPVAKRRSVGGVEGGIPGRMSIITPGA